jgi:hypothetical protein
MREAIHRFTTATAFRLKPEATRIYKATAFRLKPEATFCWLCGFRPFDKLRAVPSPVEGRLQPEGRCEGDDDGETEV